METTTATKQQHTNTDNKLNNPIIHSLSEHKVDNGNKNISNTASLKPSNNFVRLSQPSYSRTKRQINDFEGLIRSTKYTYNSVYNSHQGSRNTNLSERRPKCEESIRNQPSVTINP